MVPNHYKGMTWSLSGLYHSHCMICCRTELSRMKFVFFHYRICTVKWHFNAEISEVQRHTPTPSSSSRTLDPKTASTVEKILKFGRELHALSIRLKREFGKNEANKKALRVCVYLLTYCWPALKGNSTLKNIWLKMKIYV